jgi:agmatinase
VASDQAEFDPSGPATGGGVFGLPQTAEQAQVVLIAVPWEPTTSYGKGTAGGPAAILEASRQVDLFDVETGRPYQAGIHMLPVDLDWVAMNDEACRLAQPIIDAGGAGDDAELQKALARVNELSLRLDEQVYLAAVRWLDAGKIVGLVGGDHASPFGAIRAHAERFPGLGVLHVDAHADLRVAYEGFQRSHASIMNNVLELIPGVGKLVQVGLRDLSEEEHDRTRSDARIAAFFDADFARQKLEGATFARLLDPVIEALPPQVYVSFDIDGLDPALCPSTGTPVPGGLSFHEASYLVRRVVESGRTIVGFDLNEVAPGPAGDDWPANVGARVLYKLIGWTLRSRQPPAVSTAR